MSDPSPSLNRVQPQEPSGDSLGLPADLRAIWRRVARYGLILVVAGSIAVAVLSQLGRVSEVRLRFEPLWLALAAVGFTVFLASQMEAFRSMLRVMGAPLPPPTARSVYCASLLARYVPTGMLAFVVRVTYGDREGVPKRVSLAILIYELTLATAAAVVISAYFIVSLPAFAGVPERWLLVAVPVGAIVLVHPRVFGPLTTAVLGRLGREPLELLLSWWAVLRFLVVYGLGYLAAGVGTYALVQTIHPVSSRDALVVVAAYSLAAVSGMVGFMLPGGLGAREAGLVAGLAPVVPSAVAIAVAVAARLAQTGIELLCATIVTLHARARPVTRYPERPSRPRAVELE